jgi:hypothetical protein
MEVCGKEIWIGGRLIRIACVNGERYEFLQGPEAALAALRKSGSRIDLFTFIQKLSDTSPKYNYPMEWDNMAAIAVPGRAEDQVDSISELDNAIATERPSSFPLETTSSRS